MPAIDRCHERVVHALINDGWTIKKQPFKVVTPLNPLFIDLEARKAADMGIQMILLIEIKCFPDGDSTMNDLYSAIGQYLVYRTVLKRFQNASDLYLAIPTKAYHELFQPLIASLITELAMKLVLVDMERERIEQWIT